MRRTKEELKTEKTIMSRECFLDGKKLQPENMKTRFNKKYTNVSI